MRRLAILFVCCFAISAQATLLVYEPFNYSNVGGPVLGQSTTGGDTWVAAHATAAPTAINVASGSLSVPSALGPSIGNSAEIDGVGNGSGKAIRLPLGQTVNSGTVYYSFALRVDDLTGSNVLNGGLFMGLNDTAGSTTSNPGTIGARMQARDDPNEGSGTGGAGGTKYQLGVFNNVNATAAAMTGFPSLDIGTTYFIVASYTFNPGTGDDVSSVWINPSGLGAASAPTPTMTGTGGTDLADIESILLRQSPAPQLTLDELRVGTSWAGVTAIPEPSPIVVLLLVSALLVAARAKAWKLLGT
jgi:hypothetical protein